MYLLNLKRQDFSDWKYIPVSTKWCWKFVSFVSLHWVMRQISESSGKIRNVIWEKFIHYYLRKDCVLFQIQWNEPDSTSTFYKDPGEAYEMGKRQVWMEYFSEDFELPGAGLCALGAWKEQVEVLQRKKTKNRTKFWLYNFFQGKPCMFIYCLSQIVISAFYMPTTTSYLTPLTALDLKRWVITMTITLITQARKQREVSCPGDISSHGLNLGALSLNQQSYHHVNGLPCMDGPVIVHVRVPREANCIHPSTLIFLLENLRMMMYLDSFRVASSLTLI